jgi:hypothetical protein
MTEFEGVGLYVRKKQRSNTQPTVLPLGVFAAGFSPLIEYEEYELLL